MSTGRSDWAYLLAPFLVLLAASVGSLVAGSNLVRDDIVLVGLLGSMFVSPMVLAGSALALWGQLSRRIVMASLAISVTWLTAAVLFVVWLELTWHVPIPSDW